MHASFESTHTFVADTCVLVVIAYVLARGRMLALLFRDKLPFRKAVLLGLAMGLLGLLEAIFPDARFPYATHTLFVTFAAIAGGLHVGLITASVVTLGAFLFQRPQFVVGTMLAVFVSAFMGRGVRRVAGIPLRLIAGFAVGALAQACRLLINAVLARLLHLPLAYPSAWISVPANGFGVMLLLLVVTDAQVRAESDRRLLESERAHTLASEAQLAALRARMHPHFLFNALNSIATLCLLVPDRAEAAILRVSQLMRRALETSAATSTCLIEEIEAVRNYLEIEQERFGARLRVTWQVDPLCAQMPVPPFSVQTLVENAINHGIAAKTGAGALAITVRRYPRHVLVAVRDDGAGMSPEARRQIAETVRTGTHGLQILNQQLVLLYGPRARLRLFGREDAGTLAVIALPIPAGIDRPSERPA